MNYAKQKHAQDHVHKSLPTIYYFQSSGKRLTEYGGLFLLSISLLYMYAVKQVRFVIFLSVVLSAMLPYNMFTLTKMFSS